MREAEQPELAPDTCGWEERAACVHLVPGAPQQPLVHAHPQQSLERLWSKPVSIVRSCYRGQLRWAQAGVMLQIFTEEMNQSRKLLFDA